jgi:hypothetical protein
MGWSVGGIIFNSMNISERAKNIYILYIVTVVVLSAVGGFFSEAMFNGLLKLLLTYPSFSEQFILQIDGYAWSNGWIILSRLSGDNHSTAITLVAT